MSLGTCPQCGNDNVWWHNEGEYWYCETDGCGWMETEAQYRERELLALYMRDILKLLRAGKVPELK